MSSLIKEYIESIKQQFDTGQSTEHSFRGPLITLLESINPQIIAQNESQRIKDVGMPDLTIKNKKNNTINLGWIEAKDLWVDLNESNNKDQLKRYLGAFDNFIYTNNLTFNFYRQGKLVESVSLGTATKKNITWQTSDLFEDSSIKLERLLKDFLGFEGQTITSSEKLARAMAQKAQLIKYAIHQIFSNNEKDNSLYHQYSTFKELLVHDLTTDQFADMYAQTIVYGLFIARLHDPDLKNFSRHEAEKLIPKNTPFIRWLFKQMSNDDEFDDRIAHIIDDLVAIFLHCNVAEILSKYNPETGRNDPIIHFYETFLGEYDSAMRKKRGVYYTPVPVVNFIVRGVDHLLKTEFGLKTGLADTSKIEHTFVEQGKKIKKNIHRVQILDPATGTGTFLNETIKYIHTTYFENQAGIWKNYVSKDLLPRIRGFEILMASYTMAHLKLGLTLEETGRSGDDRFNIYLTNSLEEPHDNIGSLFSRELAKESEAASQVKNEQPIMVVMGNPPYSGHSSNQGEWITSLIKDYMHEADGSNLDEKNSKWLNDDYVKFIRYAQYFIDRNKEGIIGYITNNTYLDNTTFRGMRFKLLKSFDKIYILNLHGNSTKNDISPDGSKDENVFDIKTGVAIILCIKSSSEKTKSLPDVLYADLRGKREEKYDFLTMNSISSINWEKLMFDKKNYRFIKKDTTKSKEYESFISLREIFILNSVGILSHRDNFSVGKENILVNRINDVYTNKDVETLYDKYKIKKTSKFKLEAIRNGKPLSKVVSNIKKINYRVFDASYIIYDDSFVDRTRRKVLGNMLLPNIALISQRQTYGLEFNHIFISDGLSDLNYISNLGGGSVFPLYIYSTNLSGEEVRTANLNMELINNILNKIGCTRDDYEGNGIKQIGAENIFDYIYAVLHHPTYRQTYKEFLKTDFPRIPFTKKVDVFWKLVEKGRELRSLHLLESVDMSDISHHGLSFPVGGNSLVGKIGKGSYRSQRVYINDVQYFENVPDTARNFYIGGYQPAQKRLKDRIGSELTYDDIIHYQKMIVVLKETRRVMNDLNEIKFI